LGGSTKNATLGEIGLNVTGNLTVGGRPPAWRPDSIAVNSSNVVAPVNSTPSTLPLTPAPTPSHPATGRILVRSAPVSPTGAHGGSRNSAAGKRAGRVSTSLAGLNGRGESEKKPTESHDEYRPGTSSMRDAVMKASPSAEQQGYVGLMRLGQGLKAQAAKSPLPGRRVSYLVDILPLGYSPGDLLDFVVFVMDAYGQRIVGEQIQQVFADV
jgi:hypothetical protein